MWTYVRFTVIVRHNELLQSDLSLLIGHVRLYDKSGEHQLTTSACRVVFADDTIVVSTRLLTGTSAHGRHFCTH